MKLITKILTPFLEVKKWLFGKKEETEQTFFAGWMLDPFFTEENRKTEKLASLARYIEGATVVVAKRKAQKKKTSDVLFAIQGAQRERLEIETGKRTFNGTSWVLK